MFLITKSYLDSNLFEKDLKEAKALNKEIIIAIVQSDIETNNVKFESYPVFNISKNVGKCRYYLSKNLRELSLNDEETSKLFETLKSKLGISNKVCICKSSFKEVFI